MGWLEFRVDWWIIRADSLMYGRFLRGYMESKGTQKFMYPLLLVVVGLISLERRDESLHKGLC